MFEDGKNERNSIQGCDTCNKKICLRFFIFLTIYHFLWKFVFFNFPNVNDFDNFTTLMNSHAMNSSQQHCLFHENFLYPVCKYGVNLLWNIVSSSVFQL